MFSTFGEFLGCVKEARFTFDVIWQAIVAFFGDVLSNPDVSAVWNGFLSAIEPIYTIAIIVGIVLALVIAFFGRKLMGVIKFIAFFVAGFLVGTHVLAPLLPPEIAIPGWISGIVLALIAGVLSRFIYIVFYVIAGGYSMYVLTYYGFFLASEPVYSNTRALTCLAAAVVTVILILIFKKYVEMLGTAVLGSWLAVLLFIQIYDFTAWPFFEGLEWLATLILAGVVAIVAFAVQVKTRRRY
jgi:hypothetical protein